MHTHTHTNTFRHIYYFLLETDLKYLCCCLPPPLDLVFSPRIFSLGASRACHYSISVSPSLESRAASLCGCRWVLTFLSFSCFLCLSQPPHLSTRKKLREGARERSVSEMSLWLSAWSHIPRSGCPSSFGSVDSPSTRENVLSQAWGPPVTCVHTQYRWDHPPSQKVFTLPAEWGTGCLWKWLHRCPQ